MECVYVLFRALYEGWADRFIPGQEMSSLASCLFEKEEEEAFFFPQTKWPLFAGLIMPMLHIIKNVS